ncbi:unnamed protein product [Bemisia tabaci]|uniref:MI domain-containing protein n=1 Tax=Bemisia tabaci TaxID=7038 RepID=A0A9P0AGS0_BEMTA|nr:unnamed protein product [Bemisia tabaci]
MNAPKSFKGKKFKKKPKKFEIKVVSRKERRKALRKEKKSKKSSKQVAETSPSPKKSKNSVKSILKKPTSDPSKKSVRFKNSSEIQDDLRSREKQSRAQLEKDMALARRKQLMQANDEEDRNIRQLEKLLKLNKKKQKSIPKAFKEDGLDYLLEICDLDYTKNLPPNVLENDIEEMAEREKEKFKNDKTKNKRKSDDDDEAPEERSSKKPKISKLVPEKSAKKGDYKKSEEMNEDADEMEADREVEFGSDIGDGSDVGEANDISDLEDSMEMSFNDGEEDIESNSDIPDMEEEFELQSGSGNGSDVANEDEVGDMEGEFELQSGSESGSDIVDKDEDGNMEEEFEQNDSSNSDDIAADDSRYDFSDEESETEIQKAPKNKALELPDGQWEDIYGRLRDKKGNIIQEKTSGKYVPPAMREKLEEVDENKAAEMMRLRKLMKGLINRLAEGNMPSISKQVEDIYMSHSRNSTNEMLFKLFEEAIVAETLTPEKLILEHAMLIAILHANVGTEVGAYFMQELIKKFDSYYKDDLIIEDKKLDNLLYLLAHMYTFKIFNACLLYDMVNQFCDNFSEKDIDLILIVLKSVGFNLRKDDPGALKQLIVKIQLRANKETKLAEGSRVKFMIEILLAVKNNNFAKIPGYDTTTSERLKKLVKNIIRAGKYISELKITLDDLRNADQRGRWWIVGSAWTGALPQHPGKSTKTNIEPQFSSEILQLARKQRMNTDTRRNIFCILMTAEDYLDAFEKLLHLGLKGSQEQEILRVVVHCLLQEKQFNLYYAYLAQHFCEADRKYQLNIQYTSWDKFKDLSSMSSVQISNFAKFLAHLFLAKAVPISILKVLHFTDLDEAGLKFLRQLLSIILLADSDDKVTDVFVRVSKAPKLKLFRESLRLFFHHFLLKNASKLPDVSENKLDLLKRRIPIAEKALIGSTDPFG